MKLTQVDKNVLYNALEYVIIQRLKNLSHDLETSNPEQSIEELDDIKDDMRLYQKLSKDKWYWVE